METETSRSQARSAALRSLEARHTCYGVAATTGAATTGAATTGDNTLFAVGGLFAS